MQATRTHNFQKLKEKETSERTKDLFSTVFSLSLSLSLSLPLPLPHFYISLISSSAYISPFLLPLAMSSSRSRLKARETPTKAPSKVSGSLPPSSSTQGTFDDEEIIIHVTDDGRGIQRDFQCKRGILVRGMTYFQTYLNESTSCEDIDISVHCDVQVFQWLVQYLNDPAEQPKKLCKCSLSLSLSLSSKYSSSPPLLISLSLYLCRHVLLSLLPSHISLPPPTTPAVGNVVSILISSNFLQMRDLVNDCLQYFKSHISDVVRSPINLSCVSDDLVEKLSLSFSPEELELVTDKRDKILSRLYIYKAQKLVEEHAHTLEQCSLCRSIYTKRDRSRLYCSACPPTVGPTGKMEKRHIPNKEWCFVQVAFSLSLFSPFSLSISLWLLFFLSNFCTSCLPFSSNHPLSLSLLLFQLPLTSLHTTAHHQHAVS